MWEGFKKLPQKTQEYIDKKFGEIDESNEDEIIIESLSLQEQADDAFNNYFEGFLAALKDEQLVEFLTDSIQYKKCNNRMSFMKEIEVALVNYKKAVEW